MSVLEQPAQRPPGLREIAGDLGIAYLLNGLAAFVFACTAPVAIIIAVASSGGLSQSDIASWLFGGFAIGGLITIGFSVAYRQPLAFAWTIPGTVLLGTALTHFTFNEVLAACMATGLLMAVIGVAGLMRRAMQLIPMPIVMGMVAGVFLSFAIDVVDAFQESFTLTLAMVVAYLIGSIVPGLQRALPPIVVALVVGLVVVLGGGLASPQGPAPELFTPPHVYWPSFSGQAMLELVIPLAITVLAAQNAQGFAILADAGHTPPINAMTTACGVGSIAFALVGAVCTCVTGPSNAILASAGTRERHYIAGITFGTLGVLFGCFAASMTWLALALPTAFVATLGGLGILKVLQSAFVNAFGGRFSLGALVTFVITVSGVTIFNVGAPFWGVVAGLCISALLERSDFKALVEPRRSA